MSILKSARWVPYVFGGVTVVSTLIVISLSVYYYNKIFYGIFVLTQRQVDQELIKSPVFFSDIKEYHLMEGDILLRRHVTKKTSVAEMITRSYFTHAAVYYGEGKIIEAVGTEPDPKNEVVVHDLLESDWVEESLERWVVMRPLLIDHDRLAVALEKIKTKADDPNFRFGINWTEAGDKKVTSCAELIFREYQEEKIVSNINTPKLVGPDYLFWYGVNHPNQFIVAGHN